MKVQPTCHPDRKHVARGLCAACYQAWWKAENPERYAARQARKPRATCHPDRPVLARGLCGTCYRRARRAEPEYAEAEKAYAREWNRKKYADNPEYRRIRKLRRYGLTPEQYDRMAVEQEGACAACRVVTDELQVDHCHESGLVRGLLCRNCNSALGHAQDDVLRLQALIGYLDRF